MVQNVVVKIRMGIVSTAPITTGGAANYDRALMTVLQQTDFEVDIELIRFASDRTSKVIVDPDSEIFLYRKNPAPSTLGKRLTRHWKFLRPSGVPLLQEALDDQKVDLAWFMAPNRVIGSILRTPFVMPVWDLAHRQVQGFEEFAADRRWSHREEVYQRNLGRAFHVVTDSVKTGLEIERIYGVYSDNWTSLGLPLPAKPTSISTLADSIEGKYFYYPASYWPHKNHRIVIDALREQTDKNFSLVFSGHDEGHRRLLEDYVQASGLTERVRFFGRIPDEEVQGLIDGSVAVLMPSMLGPTNYPPLEAWRSNVPAIVSSVHEFDEIPESGVLEVEPHDRSGWSKAMSHMLSPGRPEVAPPNFEARGIESQVRDIVEKFLKTLRTRFII